MTIDPDEAVAILVEIASDKELMNDYLDDGIKDRILAAVKPKGPFPRHLTPTIDQLILPSGHVSYRKKGEHMFAASPCEKDAETVAWLQHRGLDLQHIADCLGDMGRLPQYRKALESILDNAEASE